MAYRGAGAQAQKSPHAAGMEDNMFVLPKGTLVKVGGLPFRLLQDVQTDGSAENYNLALSHSDTFSGRAQAESSATAPTKRKSSESIASRR